MSDEGSLMNLASHIIVDIFSRLPAITVINCKLVCKKWLSLISTPEFANLHLSRSTLGLVIFRYKSFAAEVCRIFEFEDDLDHNDLHFKFELSMSLGISRGAAVHIVSINDFVCLHNFECEYDALYIHNPITREHVALLVLDWLVEYSSQVTYVFGISTISGHWPSIPKSECHVYTFGTGTWRGIGGVPFAYNYHSHGLFFNGNLPWVIQDLEGSELISCFDVEKESFQPSSFPFPGKRHKRTLHNLGFLTGCLCLCDNTSDSEIVIWFMKEYGLNKSWIKEFVIS
ncbi:F-box protein CPR30 [Abeliophyllum distichum]|uniref:F-box protein CPR30 n=1 Tax=Abeliophyllum distichum TaxID=126358 RepID=A0ABD1SS31_9LAMI